MRLAGVQLFHSAVCRRFVLKKKIKLKKGKKEGERRSLIWHLFNPPFFLGLHGRQTNGGGGGQAGEWRSQQKTVPCVSA